MIDPSELVDNLVATLRQVADLVTEMSGDDARIYAYHDQYPKNVSLVHAIHQMPAPAIMALARNAAGIVRRCGYMETQSHAVLRARDTSGDTTPTAYYRLFRLITKGVPAGSDVPMQNVTVHPSCYPMDLPLIQRQTDAEGLDYFEVPLSFTEMGDD